MVFHQAVSICCIKFRSFSFGQSRHFFIQLDNILMHFHSSCAFFISSSTNINFQRNFLECSGIRIFLTFSYITVLGACSNHLRYGCNLDRFGCSCISNVLLIDDEQPRWCHLALCIMMKFLRINFLVIGKYTAFV